MTAVEMKTHTGLRGGSVEQSAAHAPTGFIYTTQITPKIYGTLFKWKTYAGMHKAKLLFEIVKRHRPNPIFTHKHLCNNNFQLYICCLWEKHCTILYYV